MNTFVKIIIIVIVSIIALGTLVAGGGAKSGNSYVGLLSFGILILIYFMFRKSKSDK